MVGCHAEMQSWNSMEKLHEADTPGISNYIFCLVMS